MTLIKGILLPIRAEYLVRILNGEKTQELRDRLPKGFVGCVYLYCTKAKPYLVEHLVPKGKSGKQKLYLLKTDNIPILNDHKYLNGKIVARFWFDEHDVLEWWGSRYLCISKHCGHDETIGEYTNKLFNQLCLSGNEIDKYLKRRKKGYAWHIKQLEIFDKPKELKDFYGRTYEGDETIRYQYWDEEETLNEIYLKPLTRAPQSWQYVYTKEKE